ncbi:efflux transporter, outer membrane factor (OMF) lipoprotein, NodT family [Granulicella pectinivorans]|uniref:Efflux transporter, outer membrane factor (OMF) lipoprotein, NodT family n=1 Tax=Granulicella pectinivorans TaxID=474950 RepID=A0A1I6L8A8_9BACT|nr:efflux transporter outer membrane subunit [Granulicella pectinivorans]SFR99721.1 efflux transporter, outer membrane factor (OMF) lipoprotein, NodT family [Granulicella pectinivorans]
MNTPLRIGSISLAALSLSLLAGCRVGPHYTRPAALPAPPPTQYKEAATPAPEGSGDWKPAQPQDAMLRGKWWLIYNDAELNDLEDKLNIDNQNIKQYFQNYMEARTLIAQARSQLYPTLGVAPSVTRSRSSANTTTSTGTNATTTGGTTATTSTITTGGRQTSLFSIPFEASWEPDLFGKVRNQVSANQYAAQVSAADLENERLSEQSNLAIYLFELRGQDALSEVYKKTIEADRKSVELTRGLYDTGIDDQAAVVEAENTLQNAEAAATNLGILRAQYEHAIAVLVGVNPSSFSIPTKPLDATPPAIPIGMPSQLLERRPDVAAAERQMASANALIGVATAAYFPTIPLTASAGTESAAIAQLFDWPSRVWSVGASASETIFDAGLRRATVNQDIATYNADVAAYRQTVLTAFQQVEDYIASSRILARQYLQQQTAAASAQKSLDLETARYEAGVDPYLNVVQTQLTLLSDQTNLVTVRTSQMTASVQLIQALGGGWSNSDLPTPAQVSARFSKADSTIQK